ncbi:Uncharacterised protein [Mesomycoplasma dispar]|uniref:Uncharacterized protein n=1 Tax=Mesomycoplasma dispar TaxID=86660 RepID=A0AAJ5NSM0_9BACT|nr:hypothetical protein [Mesomycoplasma dispar]AJR12344.1 hypothetical protein MDIS_03090 [Mesomycoplasma dispar]VEU62188.1 Uncharacterised protein [Mesomycoplasma dispar]
MAFVQKFKINIPKTHFYSLIFLSAFLTLALVSWILVPFVFGTHLEKINKTNQESQREILVSNLAVGKLTSYFATNLFIIFFAIYLFLAYRKVKIGYFFYFFWIFVFSSMAGYPFFQGAEKLNQAELISGIFISIFSGFIVISLFYSVYIYRLERIIAKYKFADSRF